MAGSPFVLVAGGVAGMVSPSRGLARSESPFVLAGRGDGQPQSWPRIAASFPPGVAMPAAGPSRGPNGARLPPAAAASLFTMTYVRMEDVPRVGNIVIPGNHKEF
jgi:hypothetical protein